MKHKYFKYQYYINMFNVVRLNLKTHNYILGLLLFFGCTEIPGKQSDDDSLTKSQVQTYADTTPTTSSKRNDVSFKLQQYGEEIISGRVKPSDNEQTFAWLDSLQSDNPSTRNFAFRVYKVMVVKSDGALSETISGHIKNYFSSYPEEFLVNYKTLNNQEKTATQESIAFEFYASGTDFQKDLDNYFENIKTLCQGCTKADLAILVDMRSSLEVKVRQMVE